MFSSKPSSFYKKRQPLSDITNNYTHKYSQKQSA